jgi:hypothetical protein
MNFASELKTIRDQSSLVSARKVNQDLTDRSVGRRSDGDGRKDTLISGFSDEDIDEIDLSDS